MFHHVRKIFAWLARNSVKITGAIIPLLPSGTLQSGAIAGTKIAEVLMEQGFDEKEAQETAKALENNQKHIAKLRRDMRIVHLLIAINLALTALIFLRLF